MIERATAFHEAGHMVAAWHFRLKLNFVEIDGSTGQANFRRSELLSASDPAWCEIEAVTFLAGPLAERIHGRGPASREAAWRDLDEIKTLAWAAEPSDPQAFCRRVRRRTRDLLRERHEHVVAVAKALLETRRIEGRELQAILDGRAPTD